MKKLISLKVNGMDYDIAADTSTTLVDVLREDLGLTGVKKGCDDGDCGACTILMDGKAAASCTTLAAAAQGHEITTIEGLAKKGKLHPMQQAFIDCFAIQCGYCTPGMILSAKALLDENPNAAEDEIREALHGNICRCTGYKKIVEAIEAARDEMNGKA